MCRPVLCERVTGVKDASAGIAHSLFLTGKGEVLAVGSNEHG